MFWYIFLHLCLPPVLYELKSMSSAILTSYQVPIVHFNQTESSIWNKLWYNTILLYIELLAVWLLILLVTESRIHNFRQSFLGKSKPTRGERKKSPHVCSMQFWQCNLYNIAIFRGRALPKNNVYSGNYFLPATPKSKTLRSG